MTAKAAKTPDDAPRPKRRVPPAPGRKDMPPAPSFGWIGDPDGLTHGEIEEMCRAAKSTLREIEPAMLLPYAAVAYARRENRSLYPWDTAKLLRPDEVEVNVLDDQADDPDAHAAAQALAIERDEPMPDPA